jgi:hypothetical protein
MDLCHNFSRISGLATFELVAVVFFCKDFVTARASHDSWEISHDVELAIPYWMEAEWMHYESQTYENAVLESQKSSHTDQ